MSHSPLRERLAGLALVVSLLAACGGSDDEPLRIGVMPWPGYAFLHVAQDLGYFADEGVSVRLVEFGSLSDTRGAFERGDVDGMGCTVIELVEALHGSQREPQVTWVCDWTDGADVVLAAPAIASLADLRGRRVAVEPRSLGTFVLSRALAKVGATNADVQLVMMDQLGMASALAAGRVDAVVTYPPASLKILDSGAVRTLFTSAEIPGEVVDILVFDGRAVRERADEIERVQRAYRRALESLLWSRRATTELVARHTGMSSAEIESMFDDGIRLVQAHEQARFFTPGGELERVIGEVVRALHADAPPGLGIDSAAAIGRRFHPVPALP